MQKKTQLLNFVVPLLTLLAVVGTALVGRPASVLAASPKPSEYFYIVSGLSSSLYADAQDNQTNADTQDNQINSGTAIVADNKKYPPTDSQLWTFVVPSGETDGYGYLQSKSKATSKGPYGDDILVLDIQGAKTADDTPVIASYKKPSVSDNQLWKFVSDNLNNGQYGQYGYFQSKSQCENPCSTKSNLVLDIQGAKTADGTPVIANSQDQPLGPNQIWIEVPQFFT